MRRLPLMPIATLALTTAVVTPALVLLPTVAPAAARPHPVAPRVVALDPLSADPGAFSALAAPGAPALGRALTAERLLGRGPALLTPQTSTRHFDRPPAGCKQSC